MSDDLAARLRAYKPDHREPDIQDLDCIEAAAALEAKDARIKELGDKYCALVTKYDAAADRILALTAERDAALRRAEEADALLRELVEAWQMSSDMVTAIRNARAYLAAKDAP